MTLRTLLLTLWELTPLDLASTYAVLHLPSGFEANPVLAPVYGLSFAAGAALKVALLIVGTLGLLAIDRRTCGLERWTRFAARCGVYATLGAASLNMLQTLLFALHLYGLPF